MESLNDKLKSMGVSLGAVHLNLARPEKTSPREGAIFPIEKVVDGHEIESPYGKAFVVTKKYPLDFLAPHTLAVPGQVSSTLMSAVPQPEFIFMDTETSGLAGGSGTFAFLIGLGYFEEDHFLLHQIFMRHPEEEPGVIAVLNALIGTTNTLVTFNGKSFDVPLLNTRHKMHGFSPVFQKDTHFHIDMLTFARRIWKNRLPSRSLGDLERQVLDIYRTDEEVPGFMIPDIYFDYLATGDARPLSKVIYHNAMDIISLAVLFNYTNTLLLKPLHQSIDSMDLAAIGRIFEKQVSSVEAAEIYQAAIDQGLPQDILVQTLMRYANIYKQDGLWEKATVLWEKAAESGSFDAALELAKYYEHQLRDLGQAISWTQKCLAINKKRAGQWSYRQTETELNRRLARLGKKAAR